MSVPQLERVPRRRALVVDDEEPLARLVAGYLQRDGFEVHVSSDGPSGLEVVRYWEPDLVVLDLGLPELDGLDFCRQLREFDDAGRRWCL